MLAEIERKVRAHYGLLANGQEGTTLEDKAGSDKE